MLQLEAGRGVCDDYPGTALPMLADLPRFIPLESHQRKVANVSYKCATTIVSRLTHPSETLVVTLWRFVSDAFRRVALIEMDLPHKLERLTSMGVLGYCICPFAVRIFDLSTQLACNGHPGTGGVLTYTLTRPPAKAKACWLILVRKACLIEEGLGWQATCFCLGFERLRLLSKIVKISARESSGKVKLDIGLRCTRHRTWQRLGAESDGLFHSKIQKGLWRLLFGLLLPQAIAVVEAGALVTHATFRRSLWKGITTHCFTNPLFLLPNGRRKFWS